MCAPGHAEIPVHPQRSVIQQMVTEGLYMVANLTFTRTHTHTHTHSHTHTHTHRKSAHFPSPIDLCSSNWPGFTPRPRKRPSCTHHLSKQSEQPILI